MHKLNLIPKEILKKQAKKKRHLACILIFGILTVIFIYSLILIDNMKISFENDIKKNSQEIVKIKTKYKNYDLECVMKDLEKREAIYTKIMTNRIEYSQIFNQVMSFKWENIVLYSLRMDCSNYFVIEGCARRNSDIAQVLEDVKTMDNNLDVALGFIRRVEAEDNIGTGYHFEIMARFIKD